MSDISSILATPIEFTHNGKTYPVSLLKQKCKAAFERWVKQQAWASLEASRDFIPPDEYEEDKATLKRRQESGFYGYHGKLCQEAQATQQGGLVLASILFGCSEDEMVEIAATRAVEIRDILAQVIAESMPSTLGKVRTAKAVAPSEGEAPNVQTPETLSLPATL